MTVVYVKAPVVLVLARRVRDFEAWRAANGHLFDRVVHVKRAGDVVEAYTVGIGDDWHTSLSRETAMRLLRIGVEVDEQPVPRSECARCGGVRS